MLKCDLNFTSHFQPECLIEAGGMEDGITDFWQFHVYPSGGSWDTGSPFDNRVVAEYGYDLPVIVGEFPAQVWEQTNNGVPLPNDETTEEMVSP